MFSAASQTYPPFLDLHPSSAKDSPWWVQEHIRRRALDPAKSEIGELALKQETQKAEELKSSQFTARYDADYGNLLKSQEDIGQAVKLVGILKACASQKDLHTGSIIHDDIARRGLFEKNVFVGNAIVNLYAKCGALEQAQDAFDKLLAHDVVSWNTLIAGYVQHGLGREALQCFEQMLMKGFSPTAITIVCILKACGSIGALDKGQQLHARILKEGFLENDMFVANALVHMYAKCGQLQQAQEIFDELQATDVVSWNALVAGYTHHDLNEEALHCFDQMQLEGFSPNTITFVCVLKACGSGRAAFKGQELHAEIVKEGLLEKNLSIGTALVDMYAKCGLLAEAQDVFQDLPVGDVVSWTALITGYAQHEDGQQALLCFEWMQLGGFSPNAFTFAGVLKACGSVGASAKGRKIHAEVLREGLLEKDFVVASSLVDMYAKCGMLQKAQEVFDEVRIRDVVTWNALIGGYAQYEHGEKALDYFEEMLLEGVLPDAVTFVCVLKACGNIGAVYQGQELHAVIVRDGCVEKDTNTGTALVDMYANCGMLAEAQYVFERLMVQDGVAWNALLVGYAQLGVDEIVFSLLKKMIREGKELSLVTFIIVLNACSHRGLLDVGEVCFEMLNRNFGIMPTLQHYSCMIDLFGRAGHLGMAAAVMEKSPFPASPAMWHTFLGACIKWDNTDFGRWAFQHVLGLDENDGAAYICMNNIQAAGGTEEDMFISLELEK